MTFSVESRFAIVPIIRGKMKSKISNRIVSALRDSSVLSTSPLMKRLILRNVQAYCIVIETSGIHSLKIICASVPYLLSLLSRANPKLKRLLEDDQVCEYLKFFQEADMESLLSSLCTATVIFQRGLELCYPTLCFTLSRDALLLCRETWRFAAKLLRDVLASVFRFAMEDLEPAVRSVCAQNREVVVYLSKNLPRFALAGAKGLVVFSFLVRRLFAAALRSLKRFLTSLKTALLEKSVDFSLYGVLERIYVNLKSFASLLLSGCTLHYLKFVSEYVRDECVPYSKNILLSLSNASVKYLKRYFPLLKKLICSVAASLANLFSESNLRMYMDAICNARPLFNSAIACVEPYYAKLSGLAMRLCVKMIETGKLSLPHIQNAASILSKALIQGIVFFIQNSVKFYTASLSALSGLQKAYPSFKTAILKIFQVFLEMLKSIFLFTSRNLPTISRQVKNNAVELHRHVTPHLYPAACELNSALVAATTEIVVTSFHGSKRVVPTFLSAIRTVSPHSLHAMSELVLSSKNSVMIMYPAMRNAAVAIHPDVLKSLTIVLQDGRMVLVEVASVTYTASRRLVLVAKEVSHRLPIVIRAVDQVSTSAVSATDEVLKTSFRAQSRVTKDIIKAGKNVGCSFKALEHELRSTLNEVVLEINCIVLDNPEIGYFYKAFTEEAGQVSVLSDRINYLCYMSFLITSSSIGLFKKFHLIYQNVFQSSTDGEDNSYSLFNAVLCKVVDSFDFEEYINLTYESVLGLVYSVTYCVISCISASVSVSYSEFCEQILPNLWKYFKRSVSVLWNTQCEVADDLWTFLEKTSPKLWDLICKYTPGAWDNFKDTCRKMWPLACKVSPSLWQFLSSTTPLIWNYNRKVVQSLWRAYLQTCSDTWNVIVPLTSSTWECTLNTTPKVWVSVSENSKHQWQVFCDSAEHGYESVTGLSASSWDFLNKIITSSWNYAVRPATLSACCTTSSIVAKSIKLSHITYTKTGKFLLLCIELPGTKFQSMKIEVLSSKLSKRASNTRDILRKCVTFSNENILARGSKRKLVYKAIKEMSSLPGKVTDCLKVDSIFSNLLQMYKIPLIPVTRSCAFGQELYKKYCASDCLQENLIFSSCGPQNFM